MTYSSSGSGHNSTVGVILGVLFGVASLFSIAFLWWYCCWRPRSYVVYNNAQPGDVVYVQYQAGYLPAPAVQNPTYAQEVEYESRIFAPPAQYAPPVYPSNPGAGVVVYAQPVNRY